MFEILCRIRVLFHITLLGVIAVSSVNVQGEQVLNPGEFKLFGRLEGYSEEAGFDLMLLYGNGGILFDIDHVEDIHINEDGTFYKSFMMDFPCQMFINIDNVYIKFYAEPQSRMFLNIDLTALRNFILSDEIEKEFDGYMVYGPLAEINRLLYQAPPQRLQYSDYKLWEKECLPEEFKDNVLRETELWAQDLRAYIESLESIERCEDVEGIEGRNNNCGLDNTERITPEELYCHFGDDFQIDNTPLRDSLSTLTDILRLEPYVNSCNLISRYLLNRAMGRTPKDKRGKVEPEFYDFFKEVDLDDITLFATSNGTDFQNNIEFSFLAERLGEGRISQSLEIDSIIPQTSLRATLYKTFFQSDTLPLTLQVVIANHMLSTIELAQPELEEAYAISDSLMTNFITYPLIRQRVSQRLDDIYKKNGYELGDSPAEELIKNIIAPYKGKIVVMDFWGTTCGPCLAAIKANQSTIKYYSNSMELEYIFITDELSSPNPQTYESFVSEYLPEQSVLRLDKNVFAHISALFGINAIPRYVIFSKDGKVVEDKAKNPYDASSILQKYN